MSERIVILGFLSHFPVPGVAWQTLHYLVGFQRLGFDVYYVEAHGCTPGKLMKSDTDDGPVRAATYINNILRRFDLGQRWAYYSPYPVPRCFGMSERTLKELYRSSALIINLHGSHIPAPEYTVTNRLVYLETDPVDVQVDLFQLRQETLNYLSPHAAFFTFGENLGKPDCLVPKPKQFHFFPTRQPVVMDFWDTGAGADGNLFTTIGNWKQPWREVSLAGQVYRWSKHWEFLKFIDLPQRTSQPFELALSSMLPEDERRLKSHGWRVREALQCAGDMDSYREYISQSKGEFTVAKEQNIRLRSGWFSDRAATYLAAGRPVITQETAFSNVLPTGEGLFGFASMEEILAALEKINSDYTRHRRAARAIAREYFSHEVVLGQLLRDLGVGPRPVNGAKRVAEATEAKIVTGTGFVADLNPPIPPDLVLRPTGRWPTRLPDETIHHALALSVPVLGDQVDRPGIGTKSSSASEDAQWADSKRASVIVVTHNGLAYTKLCVTALLRNGWAPGDELILVDNGSSDGTREFVRELERLNPFVRTILVNRNLGFARGNNLGIAAATGDLLVLLNSDTVPPRGWREHLLKWLRDTTVGLAGPVTNRACNEAQIDAPYRTLSEMEEFAIAYTARHAGEAMEIPMLAMFCLAMRRDVFEHIGPLDERFEIGMFEDDDYSRRVRQAGYKILCAEDAFMHHFGQGSFGELCPSGDYDRVLDSNRRHYEKKWDVTWRPHKRRVSSEYKALRDRVRQAVTNRLPNNATVAVISKGDNELLTFNGHQGWHFPQRDDGTFPDVYPADSEAAIAHLEMLRAKGAAYLLVPKPSFWWLEHYGQFRAHLDRLYTLAVNEAETCLVYNLADAHV